MEWLITIFALGIVIFIHELGHLLAAKYSGIGAPEFSIGFGPKIWSWQGKETIYVLRLLPLGGFVKIAGMDDSGEPISDEQNYYKKSFFKRFITIFAGAAMNILLGAVIFCTLFAIYGRHELTPTISAVLPGSAAYEAKLQVGDQLVSLDGHKIVDVKQDFIMAIRSQKLLRPVTLEIVRGGQPLTLKITPKGTPPQLGVGLATGLRKFSVLTGIKEGVLETGRQIGLTFLTIKMLITGTAGIKELAGPVGILQMASSGLNLGIPAFLGIMGMISIGLGTANLLPLPVLDGGHILFLIIEKIRGKRLSPKVEGLIYNLFAILLIGLMILIVGNDILHWQDRLAMLRGNK